MTDLITIPTSEPPPLVAARAKLEALNADPGVWFACPIVREQSVTVYVRVPVGATPAREHIKLATANVDRTDWETDDPSLCGKTTITDAPESEDYDALECERAKLTAEVARLEKAQIETLRPFVKEVQ